jgi:hypothetical protein
MCVPCLRLAILLAIVFLCVGVIEETIYLSIAVFNMPLLAVAPVAVVLGFLVFVGRRQRWPCAIPRSRW